MPRAKKPPAKKAPARKRAPKKPQNLPGAIESQPPPFAPALPVQDMSPEERSLRLLESAVNLCEAGGDNGTPWDQILILLDITKEELDAEEELRELLRTAYNRGRAKGIADVIGGVKRAATQGDIKAAEYFFDLTGTEVVPKQSDGATGSTSLPKRLFVEVTTADD